MKASILEDAPLEAQEFPDECLIEVAAGRRLVVSMSRCNKSRLNPDIRKFRVSWRRIDKGRVSFIKNDA